MRLLRYGTAVLLIALAQPADAQYRRRTQELPPLYAVSLSAGALLPYDETITAVRIVEPDQDLRGLRHVGASPWISVSARYGRGIGVYANASAAFAGDAELRGVDPLTGLTLEGDDNVGTVTIASAGVSFAPLTAARGLRLEAGPTWIDLGSGGTYWAGRLAVQARFLGIGDRGGIFAGWEAYLAGGTSRDGDIEYQVRKGNVMGVRAGYEYAW